MDTKYLVNFFADSVDLKRAIQLYEYLLTIYFFTNYRTQIRELVMAPFPTSPI